MKHPLIFTILLVLGTLARAEDKPKKTQAHYIPIKCIARMVVHDFGTCKKTNDSRFDCPNAHISFAAGCESVKPEQSTPTQMNVISPTAVKTSDQETTDAQ